MNKSLIFATPMIVTSGATPDELAHEWRLMVTRSLATEAFLKGKIDQEEWEDLLDQCGVDVVQLAKDWEDGQMYL